MTEREGRTGNVLARGDAVKRALIEFRTKDRDLNIFPYTTSQLINLSMTLFTKIRAETLHKIG